MADRRYRGFGPGDVINGGVYHSRTIHRIHWKLKSISIHMGGGCMRVLYFHEFDRDVVGL